MSDKNLDVVRAIASVGGEHWTYYSFKPVLTNTAKTGASSSFTYNELGEPEYISPHLPLPAPSYNASPDDEYLENAAYPETHPDEVWNDVPAPEDHTARFIAPAPQPVPVQPSPFPFPSESPSSAQVPLAQTRPGYVPFLPSTLPQASVQTSAQLYRTAERRAPSAPGPAAAPALIESPGYVPTSVAPVEAAPAVVPPHTTYRPSSAPIPAPPPPVVAVPRAVVLAPPRPSVVAPSPPAPSPPVTMRSAAIRSAPAAPQPTTASQPYPKPSGTLADMYARLASHSTLNTATSTPPAAAPDDDDEQKMFRRI